MKRLFIILAAIFFLSTHYKAYSQLNFFFLPEVYGRSIDGLGTFQVQNLSGTGMQGQVMIFVRENLNKVNVVTIITPVAVFNPGVGAYPKALFSGSVFNFSQNVIASISNQTRQFPPGEYSFCFRFVPTNKLLVDEYENCFDAVVQPLVPISLIVPANEDTICIKRPALSWQPPLPYHSTMRFRLLLTEKKNDGPMETVLKGTPLLLLDNISTTTINYPSTHPELKEGKTYYWQVVAYQQGLIISTSEVWEFTVQCSEPSKPGINDSYRELKLLMNGNYYIANRSLKFSFQNNYAIKKLKYSIHTISQGNEELKHLPEVLIQSGLNKIDIDLSDLDLQPGQHYLLKVYPFNEPPVEVRFIYEERDN